MRKCSTFLAIKEMQIKMTPRFPLIPVTMAIIKNTKIRMQGRQGKKTLCSASGKQISAATKKISMEVYQKN
jgi:hypothetical protein